MGQEIPPVVLAEERLECVLIETILQTTRKPDLQGPRIDSDEACVEGGIMQRVETEPVPDVELLHWIIPIVIALDGRYHDPDCPVDRLATLSAKTTCKDRWRQIINEADRLRDRPKYLCTLQQGLSSKQLSEMKKENVILVVPKEYIKTYPEHDLDYILSLEEFIRRMKIMLE